jgi:uncharacterized membrane protein YgcG
MTHRSTFSFIFFLVVAVCCILGHGVVQAEDTACGPEGTLTVACTDAAVACQAECTDTNDMSCLTDCGEAAATCAQAVVANCTGVINSCDPDGSLAAACATGQSDCQLACVETDPTNPDCYTTCTEDFEKCFDEIDSNCSGSGGNGNPTGGGGTGGASGGGGNNGGPTSTSSQGSGNGSSDAMIMNTGKAGLFLVPVFTLLCGLW